MTSDTTRAASSRRYNNPSKLWTHHTHAAHTHAAYTHAAYTHSAHTHAAHTHAAHAHSAHTHAAHTHAAHTHAARTHRLRQIPNLGKKKNSQDKQEPVSNELDSRVCNHKCGAGGERVEVDGDILEGDIGTDPQLTCNLSRSESEGEEIQLILAKTIVGGPSNVIFYTWICFCQQKKYRETTQGNQPILSY